MLFQIYGLPVIPTPRYEMLMIFKIITVEHKNFYRQKVDIKDTEEGTEPINCAWVSVRAKNGMDRKWGSPFR